MSEYNAPGQPPYGQPPYGNGPMTDHPQSTLVLMFLFMIVVLVGTASV